MRHFLADFEDIALFKEAEFEGEVFVFGQDLCALSLDVEQKALASESCQDFLNHFKDSDYSGARRLWVGPERNQQFFVAFMATYFPEELPEASFELVQLEKSPALSEPEAFRKAEARVVDGMHTRMLASIWRCICDAVPIPAVELSKILEQDFPVFTKAIHDWAEQ